MTRQRFSSIVLFGMQTALLAIVAATLLIRPILKTDTPEDGMLFIGVPFALLVGLMMDNFSEMAITIDSLEVFHKQRASRFYPAWAFALPTSLLRIPYSFIMAGVSTCILYYVMGFDPNPGRCPPPPPRPPSCGSLTPSSWLECLRASCTTSWCLTPT